MNTPHAPQSKSTIDQNTTAPNVPQSTDTVKQSEATSHPFWTQLYELGGTWASSEKKGKKLQTVEQAPDASQLIKLSRRVIITPNENRFAIAMLIASQPGASYPTFRNLLSLMGRIKPNEELALMKKIVNHTKVNDELLYDLEQLPRFSHPEIGKEIANLRKVNTKKSYLRKSLNVINELNPRSLGNMLMPSRNRPGVSVEHPKTQQLAI